MTINSRGKAVDIAWLRLAKNLRNLSGGSTRLHWRDNP